MAVKYLDSTGLGYVWSKFKAWCNATFAAITHSHASNAVNAMTGYSKPNSGSAIAASDSLNSAIGKLEAKVDFIGDNNCVHKTGNEVIGGVKEFENSSNTLISGDTVTSLIVRNPTVTRGTPVESGNSYTNIILADKEGDVNQTYEGRLGIIEVKSPKEGDTGGENVIIKCLKYDSNSTSNTGSIISVGYDKDEISYATAPETSDKRTNSNDIITRGYLENSEWNWQKTNKDSVVQFKPAPESNLEPVVDFMFTETGPASGDKGPSNPSTITGVSSITVTHCETTGIDSTNYTISLGSTYYGGSIDLATGVMTVTQFGVELDGTETGWWTSGTVGTDFKHALLLSSGGFPLPTTTDATGKVCSHAATYAVSYTHSFGSFFVSGIGDPQIAFADKDAVYPTDDAWKTWLAAQKTAGTPVVITYPLATPFIVQLTPIQIRSLPAFDKYKPRINTIYTDQEAVQVGYQKYTVLDYKNGFITLHNNQMTRGTAPSINHYDMPIRLIGSSERTDYTNLFWALYHEYLIDKVNTISLIVYNGTDNSNVWSRIGIGFDANGSVFTFAPKPPLDSNDDNIATTQWVHTATGNTTLNAANVTGVVAIANGGTGANTLIGAREALFGETMSLENSRHFAMISNNYTHCGWLSLENVRILLNCLLLTGGTMTGAIWIHKDGPGIIHRNPNIVRGTAPNVGKWTYNEFVDGNDNRLGWVGVAYFEDNGMVMQITCANQDGTAETSLGVGYSSDRVAFSWAPTPSSASNDTNIATTGWVRTYHSSSSDKRVKQDFANVSEDLLDTWDNISWQQYKLVNEVKESGDTAPIRFGIVVQDVQELLKDNNIDPDKYGFMYHLKYQGTDGDEPTEDNPEITKADKWYLNYNEALSIEAAYQRRKNKILERRISELETQVENMLQVLESLKGA